MLQIVMVESGSSETAVLLLEDQVVGPRAAWLERVCEPLMVGRARVLDGSRVVAEQVESAGGAPDRVGEGRA